MKNFRWSRFRPKKHITSQWDAPRLSPPSCVLPSGSQRAPGGFRRGWQFAAFFPAPRILKRRKHSTGWFGHGRIFLAPRMWTIRNNSKYSSSCHRILHQSGLETTSFRPLEREKNKKVTSYIALGGTVFLVFSYFQTSWSEQKHSQWPTMPEPACTQTTLDEPLCTYQFFELHTCTNRKPDLNARTPHRRAR